MRHGDEGLPAVELLEGGDDPRLRLRVESGRRLVEHEHGRTPHEGAGQRDALALSAGEAGAALPRRGVDSPEGGRR